MLRRGSCLVAAVVGMPAGVPPLATRGKDDPGVPVMTDHVTARCTGGRTCRARAAMDRPPVPSPRSICGGVPRFAKRPMPRLSRLERGSPRQVAIFGRRASSCRIQQNNIERHPPRERNSQNDQQLIPRIPRWSFRELRFTFGARVTLRSVSARATQAGRTRTGTVASRHWWS